MKKYFLVAQEQKLGASDHYTLLEHRPGVLYEHALFDCKMVFTL